MEALKTAILRKASGVSAISNSSGGGAGSTTGSRGSRDAATNHGDDELDLDPLDNLTSMSTSDTLSKKRSTETSTGINAIDVGKTSVGN